MTPMCRRTVLRRKLTLRNDLQQIPLLAEFVEGISGSVDIAPDTLSNINLVLEEAVSNVMKYAYEPGTEGEMDLEAILRKGSVEFILSDSGVPFDPTSAPLPDTTLGVEERCIGGLGIHLIMKIMDRVSYKREKGRNILSMTKNI